MIFMYNHVKTMILNPKKWIGQTTWLPFQIMKYLWGQIYNSIYSKSTAYIEILYADLGSACCFTSSKVVFVSFKRFFGFYLIFY